MWRSRCPVPQSTMPTCTHIGREYCLKSHAKVQSLCSFKCSNKVRQSWWTATSPDNNVFSTRTSLSQHHLKFTRDSTGIFSSWNVSQYLIVIKLTEAANNAANESAIGTPSCEYEDGMGQENNVLATSNATTIQINDINYHRLCPKISVLILTSVCRIPNKWKGSHLQPKNFIIQQTFQCKIIKMHTLNHKCPTVISRNAMWQSHSCQSIRKDNITSEITNF